MKHYVKKKAKQAKEPIKLSGDSLKRINGGESWRNKVESFLGGKDALKVGKIANFLQMVLRK